MRELKAYVRTYSGDTETPITLFYKYVDKEKGFLLESRGNGKTNYSFMGKNPYAILKGSESLIIEEDGKVIKKEGKLLDCVKEYIQQYKIDTDLDISFIGGAVGVIGYDIIKQYEKIPQINPDSINTPTVHLMVFTEFIVYDHLHDLIKIIVLESKDSQGEKRAQIKLDNMEMQIKSSVPSQRYNISDSKEVKFESNMTKEKYISIVNKAKEYIYNGDIFQVVLSQRLTAQTNQEPLDLYRKLRAINPSPYLFYFNFEQYQVVGSSPEMLVEVNKNKIYTCPIAGTRKKGSDIEEDAKLAFEMKNDPKEKAEHIMLVDLARNDMGRVSKIGSVEVTQFMKVQQYSHVMHLVSLVEGEKKKEEDVFSILSSFLPAGTLSGAPKIRAMGIIEELEEEKRGIYGGCAGYFSFNGNMDMCIAIRTMIIKQGKIYLQAGAGIVADSNPEAEYEESHNKLRALVKTIGGEL